MSSRARAIRSIAITLAVLAATGAALAGRPNNDDCDRPDVVGAPPWVDVEDRIEEAVVSSSPLDPAPTCTGGVREHTVWYELTPPADGWYRLTTAGSGFDAFIWVGTGTCGILVETACDDAGGGGGDAMVTFEAVGGTTYTVMVGSALPLSDETLQLLVEAGVEPPVATADETWTLAESPIVITGDYTINPGVTVTVEPGVVVDLQQGARLLVDGALVGTGTAASPITFTGSGRVEVRGDLDVDHAIFEVLLQPDDGGSLLLADCTFRNGGSLTTVTAPTYIWGSAPYVQLDRCTFESAYLWVSDCVLAVRDTLVQNEFCSILRGYVHLDGLTVDGSPSAGLSLTEHDSPVYLDGLTITNAAGAGLDLVAGNFFLGESLALQGNGEPVRIGGAGLLPGSTVPATGNLDNHVRVEDASAAAGRMLWADVGVPYVVPGTSYTAGNLEILPGVNLRLGPATTFWGEPGFVQVRGTSADPVVIERLDPGLPWQGLQYFFRIENAVIDGGEIGARFHSSSTVGFVDNTTIQNCDFGIQNDAVVRKTRFLNNGTGVWGDNIAGALDGSTGPNSFEGNVAAVDSSGSLIDAPSNWWSDPSGPASADNPGGTGDPVIGAGVTTVPFLTAPPDLADNPPQVRLRDTYFLAEPGSKILLSWEVEDDTGVVSQRIEFDHPLEGVTVIAADLPPSLRSFEWTVPDVGFIVNNVAPTLWVRATDTAGQEGWDRAAFLIPTTDVPGTLTITTDLSGPFRAGDEIGPLCWNAEGTDPTGATISAAIVLDADGSSVGLGGVTTYLSCLSGSVEMPFVSTESARMLLALHGSLNRVKYFFSEPFTIRPDGRIGDSPPAVELTSPVEGQSFAGGGLVPIHWTATDDEALRGFDLQASYDGGRTWHAIVQDLPGTSTFYDWRLPSSTGISDVRVRVIARDLRFQNSSAGDGTSFSITPGTYIDPGACAAPPGEVQGVVFVASGGTLAWDSLAGAAAFDVARGHTTDLVAGPPATCMETGWPETTWSDAEVPSPGQAFYYVVRASNACGTGSWGSGTGGAARATPDCP